MDVGKKDAIIVLKSKETVFLMLKKTLGNDLGDRAQSFLSLFCLDIFQKFSYLSGSVMNWRALYSTGRALAHFRSVRCALVLLDDNHSGTPTAPSRHIG